MRVGVIGFGNMGSAMAEGISRKIGKENVIVFDRDPERLRVARDSGFPVASDTSFLVRESDLLLLAVKPKDVRGVLETVREEIGNRIILSVAAGVSRGFLMEHSGTNRVVRLMPNINAFVGRAVIAVAWGEGVSEEERRRVEDILSGCGTLYPLPEELFDAFTALAGSGPAFVLSFIEALALAGLREGLPYGEALKIAVETVLGTAELLKASGLPPVEWMVRVASPGGTTVEGIKVLEERGFRGAVMECVAKTSEKARRLKV